MKKGEPVYLTKNGYGSMVVLSLEQYETLTDEIELRQPQSHWLKTVGYGWKEHTFWTDGYFACSVGNISEEMLRKYIENQG